MIEFLSWLPSGGWSRLLADTLWQSTFLAAVGLAVARFLVRQPAARAFTLLATLTACLAVPLASGLARSAGWVALRPASEQREIAEVRDEAASIPRPVAVVESPTRSVPAREPSAARSAVDRPVSSRFSYKASGWTIVLAAWASASSWLVVRLLRSVAALRQLLKRAVKCDDPMISSALLAASQRVGLKAPPCVLISDAVTTPMVAAYWKATLLLPTDYQQVASGVDWTASFTHELAHIVRRDGWAHLWAQIVRAILPCQPLVWLAVRKHKAACEEACDDWTVATGNDATSFAQSLTVWMARPQRKLVAAIGVSGNKSRVLRLLAVREPPAVLTSRGFRFGVPFAAGLLVAGLAMAQISTDGALQAIDREPTTDADVLTTIAGRCVDEKHEPVAGAVVKLFSFKFTSNIPEQDLLDDATTDRDGKFRFSDVAKAARHQRLTVVAQMPDRATATAHFQGKEMQIVMAPSATLEGRVVDEAGAPVSGAMVWCPGSVVLPVEGIRAAMTDADGYYAIDDLQAFDVATQGAEASREGIFDRITHCIVNVTHPNFARQPARYTKVPSRVDVTVHPAAVVDGTITHGNSAAPASGAHIQIYNDDVAPDYWNRAVSDEQGRFRIANLPPGPYDVIATLEHHASARLSDVALKAGSNSIDIPMQKGAVIRGRVIDVATESPVSLAEDEQMSISVHNERGEWRLGMPHASIRRDGAYELRVPAGSHGLGMYLGQKWRIVNSEFLRAVEVADGATIDLDIRIKRRDDEQIVPPDLTAEEKRQLAEHAAIAAINRLGGWVQTERIDGEDHVVEINMVYHEDERLGRLENKLFSDECLSYVPKFTKLKSLLLWRTQATDAALTHLRGNASLERIFIWDASGVSDEGAAHLATMPNLRSIHINNSRITDESLRHFSRLPKIEKLSLQGNRFTDGALEAIADSDQLTELMLGLGVNGITDRGLQNLSKLTRLRRLDLQHSQITDAGLKYLQGLKELEAFWYSGTGVTEAGFEELCEALPKLSELRERGKR